MTDQWDFENNGGFNEAAEQGGNGLRSWAKKVDTENKALKDQLAQISAQLQRQQLTSVFEDLGLPKQAASLYQGEPDPDKVKEWATSLQSLFGTSGTPLATPPAATSGVDAQTAANLQQFTEAGANAQPSTSIDDMHRQQNQATSIAELIQNAAQWRS